MSGLRTEVNSIVNSQVNRELGGIHRFGTASESLFRRLYSGLNRRRQLEAELRGQRSQREELQDQFQRLQREHKQRGSELERLHTVLAGLDDGIIVQDANGKVTMLNSAAQAMLGGKKAFWGSALGTLFEQYRDVREIDTALMPLGESVELSLNHRILRAQLIAIGDEDKQRIGTVILLRDITHDALAERLKDGFVSQLAREIESPVSIIKLATELLRGQPEDAALNQQLLSNLLHNVDLLDQLALELLDIANMDTGSFDVKREPVSAEQVIWSVVNGIDPDLKSRGIDFWVMTRGLSAVQLRGDSARLQWALGHLIRNGADYNRQGGYVGLAARIETHNAKDYVIIRVSDNGIGINRADLPHIFERFYRGRVARGQGSPAIPARLGQGLYVAKAICEAHGGFLRAQSQEHIGSIFTMGLPVYQQQRRD